jgi:hypothetical protein
MSATHVVLNGGAGATSRGGDFQDHGHTERVTSNGGSYLICNGLVHYDQPNIPPLHQARKGSLYLLPRRFWWGEDKAGPIFF